MSSTKLTLEIGLDENAETLLYIGLVEQYTRGVEDPIIKCKFRPRGMDAYTPLDPMKPNQYFTMLAPGLRTSELFLGVWDKKMTGWITCDIYRERGVPATTQTIWIDKDSFMRFPPPPITEPIWVDKDSFMCCPQCDCQDNG